MPSSCSFCKEKVEEVDFKSATTLRRIVSDRGKIRAREMALLPNVSR